MTISFPVLLLAAGVLGLLLAMRAGSSGGSAHRDRRPWWAESHLPWGGADEPFHPRDRDLRERAWEEAEAEYRRSHAVDRTARMDDRYGGDFTPWTADDE